MSRRRFLLETLGMTAGLVAPFISQQLISATPDPLEAVRQAMKKAWEGIQLRSASLDAQIPLRLVFHDPKTFWAIPVVAAKTNFRFIVPVETYQEQARVQWLLNDLEGVNLFGYESASFPTGSKRWNRFCMMNSARRLSTP